MQYTLYLTGFQASAAMQTISAPFWGITQHMVVIPYWRFIKTYRSLKWDRSVVLKRR